MSAAWVMAVLELSSAGDKALPSGPAAGHSRYRRTRRARQSAPSNTISIDAHRPSPARPPTVLPRHSQDDLFAMIDDLADIAVAAFIKGTLKPAAAASGEFDWFVTFEERWWFP